MIKAIEYQKKNWEKYVGFIYFFQQRERENERLSEDCGVYECKISTKNLKLVLHNGYIHYLTLTLTPHTLFFYGTQSPVVYYKTSHRTADSH